MVQADDLLARLAGGGPHVGVGFGVVIQPPQGLVEGPAEGEAEVSQLDAGHVLDQSQQVGARRHHRAADVVLHESVELPEQGLTGGLQITVKVLLRIGPGHAAQTATPGRRVRSRAGERTYKPGQLRISRRLPTTTPITCWCA